MVINQCFYMWNTNKFIRTYRRHIYLTKSDEEFYQTYQVGKKLVSNKKSRF
jgi:hypothetical protein